MRQSEQRHRRKFTASAKPNRGKPQIELTNGSRPEAMWLDVWQCLCSLRRNSRTSQAERSLTIHCLRRSTCRQPFAHTPTSVSTIHFLLVCRAQQPRLCLLLSPPASRANHAQRASRARFQAALTSVTKPSGRCRYTLSSALRHTTTRLSINSHSCASILISLHGSEEHRRCLSLARACLQLSVVDVTSSTS